MNIFKALFGGKIETEDEKKASDEARSFDLFKYDGVKALKIGRADYAVACLEKALDIKDDLEVRDYLSQALVRCDRPADAMEQLRVMASAEPDNMAIFLRMANVAYLMEDYDTMLSVCGDAIMTDKSNATAYYLSAMAYIGKKDVINGIAMLTKSIVLDENNADAYLLRAKTLLGMGDAAEADSDAQWLLAHCGDSEDVLLLKARIEAVRGSAKEAINYYTRVIDVNPFSADAYKERGRVKYGEGDSIGAEEDMRRALEIAPDDMSDVSGKYSAEGIEQKVRQAYSAVNPLGI